MDLVPRQRYAALSTLESLAWEVLIFGDDGAAGAGGIGGVPANNPYGPLAAYEACGSELYE